MFISYSTVQIQNHLVAEPLQFTERPCSPEPLRKLQCQDKLLSDSFQWRVYDPACCPPTLTWSMPSVQRTTTTEPLSGVSMSTDWFLPVEECIYIKNLLVRGVSVQLSDSWRVQLGCGSYMSVCSKYNSWWREWLCCHSVGDMTLDCVEEHQTQSELRLVEWLRYWDK